MKSVTVVGDVNVHVFKANLLSRMFLVIACISHPFCPVLLSCFIFDLEVHVLDDLHSDILHVSIHEWC